MRVEALPRIISAKKKMPLNEDILATALKFKQKTKMKGEKQVIWLSLVVRWDLDRRCKSVRKGLLEEPRILGKYTKGPRRSPVCDLVVLDVQDPRTSSACPPLTLGKDTAAARKGGAQCHPGPLLSP